MARPRKYRRVCVEPKYNNFTHSDSRDSEICLLTVYEYEAIRLIDFEKKTHEQCAELMDIARSTVTEMYECARFKISDCIVNGKTLSITGGKYRLCDGSMKHRCGKKCRKNYNILTKVEYSNTGENIMRIAVTYENENVFQHFGHTEKFKIYDVTDNKVVGTKVIDTMGNGHGALADFLVKNEADMLICGGIGGGAQGALAEAGIKLYGGVSGNVDNAVKSLLDGSLLFNPDVKCSHHEHEHGEHHCGENKHGCGGSE